MTSRDFSSKKDILNYIRSEPELMCSTMAEAEKLLRSRMPKESWYQTRILKMIRKDFPQVFVWKEAAGVYARRGIPDICCIANGKYVGFEIKRPFVGELSEIQAKTIEEINAAGGRACVVSYPEEARAVLEEELNEEV